MRVEKARSSASNKCIRLRQEEWTRAAALLSERGFLRPKWNNRRRQTRSIDVLWNAAAAQNSVPKIERV